MGHETRMRALSFETKEPETINWINNFDKDDCLLDIGANVGLYSLYAAYRKHNVISIEPDALNYALLNLNIRANSFSNYITPYSVAMHDKTKFSKFNISSYVWGGALNFIIIMILKTKSLYLFIFKVILALLFMNLYK